MRNLLNNQEQLSPEEIARRKDINARAAELEKKIPSKVNLGEIPVNALNRALNSDTPMRNKFIVIAGVLGVLLGAVSTRYFLAGSWLDLILWAAGAAFVGALAYSKIEARTGGGLYGFLLTASFLATGFAGTPDNIPGFALLSLMLSLVGAALGIVWAYAGNFAKSKIAR